MFVITARRYINEWKPGTRYLTRIFGKKTYPRMILSDETGVSHLSGCTSGIHGMDA